MKKAISLPVHLLILLFAMFAWILTGCAVSPGTQLPDSGDENFAFESIAQGLRMSSTQAQPVLRMADDAESLKTLAALVTPEHQTLLADVDFEKSVVLAAFWGVRPSGSASITIEKVSLAGDELTVMVRLNENDPNVPRVEAATYPYHLVSLARADLPAGAALHYRLVSADTLLAEGELP